MTTKPEESVWQGFHPEASPLNKEQDSAFLSEPYGQAAAGHTINTM